MEEHKQGSLSDTQNTEDLKNIINKYMQTIQSMVGEKKKKIFQNHESLKSSCRLTIYGIVVEFYVSSLHGGEIFSGDSEEDFSPALWKTAKLLNVGLAMFTSCTKCS